MAESTLSYDLFQAVRELNRHHTGQRVWHEGTASQAATTITVAGSAALPTIAGDWIVVLGTSVEPLIVSAGTSSTLTVNVSQTVSSTNYILVQCDREEWYAIRNAVRSGYRDFLLGRPVSGRDANDGQRLFEKQHDWSFLHITQTITLADGDYDYDMPDSFTVSDGDWNLQSDNQPLQRVAEPMLEQMRRRDGAVEGVPKYVAIRPKSTTPGADGQRFEALFHPTPDKTYTAEHRGRVNPDMPTPAAPYFWGGEVHSETIRAAMLAALELDNEGMRAELQARYLDQLQSSMQLDKEKGRMGGPAFRVTAVTMGSYEWFQQEIGRTPLGGLPAHFELWTHADTQRIDAHIQRGLNTFYNCVGAGARYKHHRWSWLRHDYQLTLSAPYSTGTVAVAAGVVTLTGGTFPTDAADGEFVTSGIGYTVASRDTPTQITLDDTSLSVDAGATYRIQYPWYDLPADFAAIEGDLTYRAGDGQEYQTIQITSWNAIMRMRMRNNFASRPQYGAVGAVNPFVAATGQRFRLALHPVPESEITLHFLYEIDPLASPLAAGEKPYGGSAYWECIQYAILSTMESGDGPNTQRYLRLLQDAIENDLFNAPERLGRNTERRENHNYSRRGGHERGRGHSIVTYDNS